jgi:SWI/SNF-related matrix-associated actin-dependent regulator 1 of chromatin subfamily A
VQNSPKELMSLLCFLMPLFDSKTKSSKGFDSDDEKGSDGGERMLEHFVHLEAADGGDAAAYRKLKQLFAPFVLRRKKSDVLSQIMPPKTRKVDLVDMDEATRSVYDAILDNAVKGGTVSAGQANGLAKFKSMSAQKHLFTELRKAANHPLLLRTRHLNDTEINYLALRMLNYNYFGSDATCTLQLVKNELEKMSDYDIHCAASTMIDENSARREHLEKYTLVENDLFCSPKFVRLRALLPELIEKGHRILLFSQWTRVLDLMHNLLEMLGMKFLRLDGQTDVTDRQALIDTFTNDPTIPVFLLSTRAGGMGLNLTAADVCILHDLDFNPFNDLQAEDRCQ